MTLDEFKLSLTGSQPPAGLSLALSALWYDARGDWDRAHECAQDQEDLDGSWVHAYLHRKEGDASNAQYWYSRARRTFYSGELQDEWTSIVTSLLSSAS